MEKLEMIKDTDYRFEIDEQKIRENFVDEYTKLKGWKKNKLSPEQIVEIQQQPQYKAPSMLRS